MRQVVKLQHILVVINCGGEDFAEGGLVVFGTGVGLDFVAGEKFVAEAGFVAFEGMAEYADFLFGVIDKKAVFVSVHL